VPPFCLTPHDELVRQQLQDQKQQDQKQRPRPRSLAETGEADDKRTTMSYAMAPVGGQSYNMAALAQKAAQQKQ
jgi:hypothetical protein